MHFSEFCPNDKVIFISGFLLAAFLTLTLISCSSSANNSEESKFNPALKQKILEAERNNSDELISAFIKVSEKLDEQKMSDLQNTGLRIGAVNQLIITAAGTSMQIREAARLPFVMQLELSHVDQIK